MSPVKYQKILGFKGSIASRNAFFAGDDHFLMVTNHHFSESYRRFYFKEIEAITVRRTRRGLTITIIFGFILGLFLLGLLAAGSNQSDLIGFAVMAAVPFVALVANILMGPTIECTIRTTASQEIIPMVSRLFRYRKFLTKVRHYIEASQGGGLEQAHTVARFGSRYGGPASL